MTEPKEEPQRLQASASPPCSAAVLDPCCGSRMMWFNRQNPNVIFGDRRSETLTVTDRSHGRTDGTRTLRIEPDVMLDFRALPYPDEAFKLVAFDPPHIERAGPKSWLAAKYGKLSDDWREDLRRGFAECFRVLEAEGVLVFKWNETHVKLREVLALTPERPLFGQVSGRGGLTHWLVFMKPNVQLEGPLGAAGGGYMKNVEMHDKPDTIRLDAPEKHHFAELIDGEWWWVNGCGECNGRPRDWLTYIECVEHDRCRTCGTPRADLADAPWAGKNGWQCNPCEAAEREVLKRKRLDEVAANDYDEFDYMFTDDVTCPHCGTAYQPEGEPPTDREEDCAVCGGKYRIEADFTVTYSTKVVGERVV